MLSLSALLVEDNPVNQMVGKALLTRMGMNVSVVGDGRQAIQAVAEQSFDLILMDLEMPVMNGYEAARQLRNHGLTLPILALTANVSEEDREQALRCGCDRVLYKPVEPEALRVALRELMGQQVSDRSAEVIE